MLPGSFCELLLDRLTADLRVRFSTAEARVVRSDDDWWLCEITDGGAPWGLVSLPVGPDDDEDIAPPEVEQMLVSVFEDVFDNQWPDELTDPWPLCAEHGDHPLRPGITRGKASWTSARSDKTSIPLGRLGAEVH